MSRSALTLKVALKGDLLVLKRLALAAFLLAVRQRQGDLAWLISVALS
jgi:hypothetical protein